MKHHLALVCHACLMFSCGGGGGGGDGDDVFIALLHSVYLSIASPC